MYFGTGQAECKHATVMFADVVGSMQIAAALGPERYWAVIVEVVDRCVTVVHRYGAANLPARFDLIEKESPRQGRKTEEVAL